VWPNQHSSSNIYKPVHDLDHFPRLHNVLTSSVDRAIVWDISPVDVRRSDVMLSHADKHLTNNIIATGKDSSITSSPFDASFSHIISMNPYFIFIFPGRHPPQDGVPSSRLRLLAKRPPSTSRVFSVFAPELVTEGFTYRSVALTGIPFTTVPYYAAAGTILTYNGRLNPIIQGPHSVTFSQGSNRIVSGSYYDQTIQVFDIDNIAELCYEFAAFSVSKFYDLRSDVLIWLSYK